MKIWFMYDNHTFARLPSMSSTSRDALHVAIVEKFIEDGCGIVFARSSTDKDVASAYDIKDVKTFIDKCEEYENWEARG